MSSSNDKKGSSNSTSTVQRLTSWKPPRDLTLASLSTNINSKVSSNNASATVSTSKIKFVPNLNIQRNKKNADSIPSARIKKEVIEIKREDDRRNKNRNNKNFVQTKSVFSEGIAQGTKQSSRSAYMFKESEDKSNLPPPKLNLERNKTTDKSVDDKTLQSLLRDDFINDNIDDSFDLDLKSSSDIKHYNAPIQLPLKSKMIKTNEKLQISELLKCEDETIDGKKIKNEENPKFLFFQFPDSIAVSCTTPENKETACYSMKDIHPGRLGTIQIMKSGKVRLVQGDKIYQISQSTQSSFHQDVVSCQTNPDTKTGIMASLGPITSRFLVTPDWNSLLR